MLRLGGIIGTTWGMVRAERARQGEAEQRTVAQANEREALKAAAAEKLAKEVAEARGAETNAVLEFVEQRVIAAARPEGEAGGLGHKVTLRRAIDAAVPFVAQSFPNQPHIEARLRMTLGYSFICLGDAEAATEQNEAARAIYVKHRGPDHPDTLQSMNNLANGYHALGRYEDALAINLETLALRKTKLGPTHPETLRSMNGVATSYHDLGRLADALKIREETLTLRKARWGSDNGKGSRPRCRA